jgi:hypothetical protein
MATYSSLCVACNNAGTDSDLIVKQFIRSLKGNAFDYPLPTHLGDSTKPAYIL